MWIDVILKCPNDGSWLAVTRVTEAGDHEFIGYIEDTEGNRDAVKRAWETPGHGLDARYVDE